MTLTKSVTDILNAVILSVKAILPFDIKLDSPSLFSQPFTQHSMGVLIGLTGEVRGRLIIDGNVESFGRIAEKMFGMYLDGEMLDSFAGELGNMIAGSFSSHAFNQGYNMDITPPTVLVGEAKVYGFSKAFRLPVHLGNAGTLNLILAVDLQ